MANDVTLSALGKSKPVLLSVDDDPAVSQVVARDLRCEYGESFRILRADSGASALEVLRQIKFRSSTISSMIGLPSIVQRLRGFA